MKHTKEKALDKIRGALTPYQREGMEWLNETGRGLLAYEPGCGKTLTTIATIAERDAKLTLVVAPASVVGVWPLEFEKWVTGMFDVHPVRISGYKRVEFIEANLDRDKPTVFVISYEAMRADIKYLKKITWNAIVYDETIKLQTPTSKTVKAALQLDAPLKIALNGTPISNSWGDIWATFEWLEPRSLYGSWWAYRATHAIMNPYIPGAITGWRGTEAIKKRTEPLMKRVLKTEAIKDLPAIIEQRMPFELTKAEQRFYNRIKKELLLALPDENIPIENALVELMRLRQTANGLFHFPDLDDDSSAKLDLAIELIEQVMSAGKQVIIFSSFATTVNELAKRLGSYPFRVGVITGDVPQAVRDGTVEGFTNGHTKILIGTDAMATGLNLQAASYVINLDLPYSYAKYEQRIGRAWRMGQKENVTVWNLEAVGTVDERIAKILSTKVSASNDFTGDEVRVKLSREEITNLLI